MFDCRHAHQVAFEKSDLFFICMLKPLNTQIAIDDLEIQAAKVFRRTNYNHISTYLFFLFSMCIQINDLVTNL